MSRLKSTKPVTSPTSNPLDDICPVCKSNRYLNPSLQFLINPECYHKMCSTCVDRIFTSGPASCPVPSCGKTLRKRGFHKAFFSDLKVEREVDIRKRVHDVFNKREQDFERLLDWNNYLEEVEGLIFDLVEGTAKERAEAEGKLVRYREMFRDEIEDNKRLGLAEVDLERRREKAEKEAARQRRLAALREHEAEKMDVEKEKREMLERLANSNERDAEAITRQAQRVILKRSSARREAVDSALDGGAANGSALSLRGLKKKEKPVEEKPYDPFGGVDLTPHRYVLLDDYNYAWLDEATKQPKHNAGGYSTEEFYTRAMFEAFSGLGVFIEDEVAEKAQPAASSSLGTMAAAETAGAKIKLESKMELDDVF